MYFVISVLPISITSGLLPPASVASNFCRCVPQVWYCTSTFTPGWACWNAAFAAATIGAQLSAFASTWSQTVIVAVVFLVAPHVEPATTAARVATVAKSPTAASVRLFIDKPPNALAGPSPIRVMVWLRGGRAWLIGLYHFATGAKALIFGAMLSRPLLELAYPPRLPAADCAADGIDDESRGVRLTLSAVTSR